MGKPDPPTIGYKYFMSLHMGLARGPLDEIVQINVGDVRAWPVADGDSEAVSGLATIAEGPGGNGIAQYEDGTSEYVPSSSISTVRSSSVVSINAPELFGGEKKEGGIQGSLTTLMGEPTQTVPGWIQSLLGGRVPGFLGVATLFFDGLVTSLNPYPKPWSVRVRRTLSGWDGDVWQPSLATIWMRNGMIKAMNPAHIIYESLTNRSWGRGFPRSIIDETSFLNSAQTLFNENFGMCLRWNRQGEIGSFIQQVIDHIGGSLYINRTNGLISLDLLRADYDPESLATFTYTSGLLEIEEVDTASRDDVVNEHVVKWKDPILNSEREVRVHNLASIQSLGSKNSSSTSYSGLPTAELALRVGQRDLKSTAVTLKRYKVRLDRRAWKIIPGAVFRVSAPDKNIATAVLRAGKIKEGDITKGEIEVEAVLDVFGLPAASFIAAPDTEWVAPNRTAVAVARRRVREVTYGELARKLSTADLAAVAEDSAAVAVLASKPTSPSLNFGIASRAGSADYAPARQADFVPSGLSTSSINLYQTIIPFDGGVDMGLVQVGMAVEVGDEICRLDAITSSDGITGTVTLARGCMDTLPKTHPAGTAMFFFNRLSESDEREYLLGETVDVKLLTKTSSNQLSIDLAPVDSVDMVARQNLPIAPGNMRVNGTPYGSVGSTSGTITLSWAHRDRKTILDQLIAHEDASIGFEAGTTYTVRIYDGLSDLTPNRVVTGITGTEYEYTGSMRSGDGVGDTVVFEVEAVRDGRISRDKYRFAVSNFSAGYGTHYGTSYGG